jgi:serine/threonine protein kinase
MNKMNIYHCDIKESNILVNDKEGFSTKLIDWGLSAKFDGKKIPEPMLERPFQYNLPFSVILFNDVFKKSYEKLLKTNPEPNYFTIRAFVIDYIFLWNEKRGPGHVKYMINIMEKLFENDLKNINLDNRKEIIEMEFLYFYIINYLTKILVQFTKNNEFMKMEYFTNIFLKNIDVWGLVMSYYPILNILHSNYKILDKTELRLFHKLKYIFVHYLFENATEPIDIGSLINDLRDLNIYFESANKNSKQKNISTTFKKSNTKKSNTRKNKQPRTMVFIETKEKDTLL